MQGASTCLPQRTSQHNCAEDLNVPLSQLSECYNDKLINRLRCWGLHMQNGYHCSFAKSRCVTDSPLSREMIYPFGIPQKYHVNMTYCDISHAKRVTMPYHFGAKPLPGRYLPLSFMHLLNPRLPLLSPGVWQQTNYVDHC